MGQHGGNASACKLKGLFVFSRFAELEPSVRTLAAAFDVRLFATCAALC